MDELNPEQKAASEAPSGPLLIVAGAGTGKTRTLTNRIRHFINNGVPPERICAITFTNKAAKEMAGRVAAINNQKLITNSKSDDLFSVISRKSSVIGHPFIGTFHALGASILRKEARFFGRKPGFVIFDDHDSFDIIKKIFKKLVPRNRDNEREGKIEAKEKLSFFAKTIYEIKNKASAREALLSSKKPNDALAIKFFEYYEAALKENNAFDFDDLIEKPVKLFLDHPDVLQKYRKKFDAIFVDEYQDVSPMQYELIKLLAGEHKNVSVVGDDEQLIYGWRYADLAIFLGFEKDWPGAKIAFLEENYRSTKNIIDAAAAVVANNKYRHPKTLWTKNPAGSQIKLAELFDEEDEAEWIAAKIAATYDKQLTTSNKEKKSSTVVSRQSSVVSPTTAVLYRTNAQSRAIEQALIRHNIPYHIFGGLKFYERKEIKDVVAALRYLQNGEDSLSRERLEKNLSKGTFRELQSAYLTLKNKGVLPLDAIEKFIKATGYIEYLERNFMNFSERQENIGELLQFAAHFDDLSKFLEEVALVQATDIATNDSRLTTDDKNKSLPAENNAFVHLSTIHLAKGLEFDRVFIAGCAEGILPHARSIDDKYRLEEERRLMYVAMTRAKKELAISFYDMPSLFISEIPQELLLYSAPQDGGARSESGEKYIYLDE